MELAKKYFINSKKYSVWRFVLEMSVVVFLTKVMAILIAVPVFSLLGINTQTDLELEKNFLDDPLLWAFFLVIIFAAFETFTGQMLILWASKKIWNKLTFRIIASAIVFALLHVEPILIAAVFPIGVILAWAFVTYRERSLWSAIWVTTAIHVIHNLFALWLVSLG